MLIRKRWSLNQPDFEAVYQLSNTFGISPVAAQVMVNRGISTVEEARGFLNDDLSCLKSPLLIPGMAAGVERLVQAVRAGEQVLIYGDYDVDGITGTALLTEVLQFLGARVSFYIPSRLEDGYGLHQAALTQFRAEGCSLVVTVDCGITNAEEVAECQGLGLDIVITDHHEPGETIPRAAAVINPLLDPLGGQSLAGVGVAWKLAQALISAWGSGVSSSMIARDALDLVVLGTVADVVPLKGENRIIVKHGLPFLSGTSRTGLKALIEVAGLAGKDLTQHRAAFNLAPRLNAAGRMGNAHPAVELMLTKSPQRAWELARALDRENGNRQLIEAQILTDVLQRVEHEVELSGEQVIVLASPLWHVGVIGIVAARLVDKFHRPAVLIALEGESGKGSARSIPGFSIFGALQECSGLLVRCGGHEQAAGLVIEAKNVAAFREKINQVARSRMGEKLLLPVIKVDAEILLQQVDEKLVQDLELLAPFGPANPTPVFAYDQAEIVDSRKVGKKAEHLKLLLRGEGREVDGIGFRLGALAELAAAKEAVDVVFNVDKNQWNGRETIQMKVVDFFPHQCVDGTGWKEDWTCGKPADQFPWLPRAAPLMDVVERVNALFLSGKDVVLDAGASATIQVFLAVACRSVRESGERVMIITDSSEAVQRIYERMQEVLSLWEIKIWRADASLFEQEVEQVLAEIQEGTGLCVATLEFFNSYHSRLLKQNSSKQVVIAASFSGKAREMVTPILQLTGDLREKGLRLLAVSLGQQPWSAVQELLPGAELVQGPRTKISPGNDIKILEGTVPLLEQVGQAGQTVVWVDNPRQGLDLVYQLQRRDGRAVRAIYWHQALSHRQKCLAAGMVAHRLVQVVVAPRQSPVDVWLWEAPEQVIFMKAAGQLEELEFLAWRGGWPRSPQVWASRAWADQTGATLDRNTMGRFYLALKQVVGERRVRSSLDEIFRLGKRCTLPDDSVSRIALATLEEMKLLRVEIDCRGLWIEGFPAPPRKLELNSSWRYRETSKMAAGN